MPSGTDLGAELPDHVATLPNFGRNYRTVFRRGRAVVRSRGPRARVSASSHPHQRFLLSIFKIITVLVGVKWFLIMVFIFVSLLTNAFERLFLC